MLTSYAPNFEDVILMRALKDVANGRYIDIGAGDPIKASISLAFYNAGWRGVHVEPNPDLASMIAELRSGETILQVCASDRAGTALFFMPEDPGSGTSVAFLGADRMQSSAGGSVIEVECRTLSAIFSAANNGPIHWLKIDAQGLEGAVIRGWRDADPKPWIVLVRDTPSGTTSPPSQEWEPHLLHLGYDFAYFDGLSRYYVSVAHSELKAKLQLPPNLLDDFSINETSPLARVPLQRINDLRDQIILLKREGSRLSSREQDLINQVRKGWGDARWLKLAIDRFEAEHGGALEDLGTELTLFRSLPRESLAELRLGLTERQAEIKGLEELLRNTRDENEVLRLDCHAAHSSIIELRSSHSWRLTSPLRWSSNATRQLRKGLVAWVRLRPGSRPRRIAARWISSSATLMASNYVFKTGIEVLLRPFPHLERRLRATVRAQFARQAPGAPRAAYPDAAAAKSPVLTLGSGACLIFVDHTINCRTNTGVQRVVRGLAGALAASRENVRFVKWDASSASCVLINRDEREHLGQWNGPKISPDDAAIYAVGGGSWLVDNHDGATNWLIVPEVTHLTFQNEPTTPAVISWARRVGLKVGFIFYDAIPNRRVEFSQIAATHAQYMRDIVEADRIWPISRWAADDLASFWRAELGRDNGHLPKIKPIHLPVQFDQERENRIEPTENLILCVGTIEPRKNQLALVRAFQGVSLRGSKSPWTLVLAGNLHPAVAAELQAAVEITPSIQYLGHVSDAELTDLYRRCAFTVFPSVEEGYGLPILESVWHAKPFICANFGAMAEVAEIARGGLTVDVREVGALRGALKQLMFDGALRRRLTEEATTALISSWPDYIEQLQIDWGEEDEATYFWVDSTIAYPSNSGIQRVARQLARALMKNGHRLIPVKWGGAESPIVSVSPAELAHFAKWNGPPVEQWQKWDPAFETVKPGWFIQSELPLNLSCEEQKLVRATFGAAGVKVAAILYDTIPWTMRNIYPSPFVEAFKKYLEELTYYDLVLAISEYTRTKYIEVMRGEFQILEKNLSHVVTSALAGEFPSKAVTPVPSSSSDAIKILCVGTVEPRKNHEVLLDAFELAAKRSTRPMHLVIVGSAHSIEPQLGERVRRRVFENPDVSWEERASDEEIQELYSESDFTIYPSVEEGFGMPILESLYYGKPVVCAEFGVMAELAQDGGCLVADVRKTPALAEAILTLVDQPEVLEKLSLEAKERKLRSWREYAEDVAGKLGLWSFPDSETAAWRRSEMLSEQTPLLSVCISTYNRSGWLSQSLLNIARLYPRPIDGVEFVICDNCSTDRTPEVVKPYLQRPDVVYKRNLKNVGMLGNLQETVTVALGKFVWILGDDDLLMPGAIERVLRAITEDVDLNLIYLNYAYTRIADARTITDFSSFFSEAIPIVPPEPDLTGPIREICARNENFFTAIYALVFRRDHALGAYSQDTTGAPFSTMLTCIPTTYYVLNHLMDKPGMWIGDPLVVVNMNVSWSRYAPLWILERIPEVLEIAKSKGVPAADLDRWRRHHMPGVSHFFAEIYRDEFADNAKYFDPARLIGRINDLPEFAEFEAGMLEVYTEAFASNHPAAAVPPQRLFKSKWAGPT